MFIRNPGSDISPLHLPPAHHNTSCDGVCIWFWRDRMCKEIWSTKCSPGKTGCHLCLSI